jgi:Bacterial capsule synthesis protein PGA_cap
MEWQDDVVAMPERALALPNWSMVVCGDWAPTKTHVTAIQRSPEQIYGDLMPILRQSDLSLVNLECVLVDDGFTIIKDGPPLKAPPDMVKGLQAVPFSVVCLANNHIMDYGEEGLRATLEVLQAHQMPVIGAGLNLTDSQKPYKTLINGVRLSILNAAEGEEAASTGGAGVAPLNIAHLTEQISRLRGESDVIVVVAHAGREVLPFPPPYIQRSYRALIDAGADVVVAHHPHTPQGIEIYNQGLIAYSLGNFAFLYGQSYFWSQLGYMLQLNFAGSKLHSATIIPYKIFDDSLMRLKGTEKTAFLDELKQFSDLLAMPQKMGHLWEAYADLWLEIRFKSETTDWLAALLSAEDLIHAAASNLTTLTGLRGRLVRRTLAWFEKWLRRSTSAPGIVTDRQKQGAAILRNRFDTLAHRELHLTALERIMSNKVGTSDKQISDLLQNWFYRTKL